MGPPSFYQAPVRVPVRCPPSSLFPNFALNQLWILLGWDWGAKGAQLLKQTAPAVGRAGVWFLFMQAYGQTARTVETWRPLESLGAENVHDGTTG